MKIKTSTLAAVTVVLAVLLLQQHAVGAVKGKPKGKGKGKAGKGMAIDPKEKKAFHDYNMLVTSLDEEMKGTNPLALEKPAHSTMEISLKDGTLPDTCGDFALATIKRRAPAVKGLCLPLKNKKEVSYCIKELLAKTPLMLYGKYCSETCPQLEMKGALPSGGCGSPFEIGCEAKVMFTCTDPTGQHSKWELDPSNAV